MIELWLILAGSMVHELYAWTGDNFIISLFAPVDESLWEHFKLGYGALLLWMPIERWVLHVRGHTYAFARAAGLIILNAVVIVMFFTVRTHVPEPWRLTADIGSYLLGALAMGQVMRRWSNMASPALHKAGAPLLLLIGVLFAVFTLWKPDHLWFMEHVW